jgi:hypothetical protein
MMVKYRRKPAVVEAEQWSCVCSTPGVVPVGQVGDWKGVFKADDGSLAQVREFDWLVREPGVNGYIVVPDAAFKAAYERVDNTRRLSLPPAWAEKHPQAFAALRQRLAPILVDTNTSASMASLWVGEELIEVWSLDGFIDDDADKAAQHVTDAMAKVEQEHGSEGA